MSIKKKKESILGLIFNLKSAYDLWSDVIYDEKSKNYSNRFLKRVHNFYGTNTATFSGRDLVTFYYVINKLPTELEIGYHDSIRNSIVSDSKISFVTLYEPTFINWKSPKMKNKLRTWKAVSQEEEEKGVDAFNYYDNVDSQDNDKLRRDSLVYLADSTRGRRAFFNFRTFMIVTGERGQDFDDSISDLESYCESMGIEIARVTSELDEYISNFSPFYSETIHSITKQVGLNTVTDELAARFSVYSQGKIGREGTCWGTDIFSGFSIYKLFKKNNVDAENILICGETGSGKSFMLKFLLFQLLGEPNYNGTINDIEGFEYTPLARFTGCNDTMVIINMGEGSGRYFDPVEINLTGDKELDSNMYSFSKSFTTSTLKVLIGLEDKDYPWIQTIVIKAISKTYSDRGITPKNMSSWSLSKGLTLFDVYHNILELYGECIDYQEYHKKVPTYKDMYKLNKDYRSTLDIVVANLSEFFEPDGSRSDLLADKVILEEVVNAKLVVNSFGMAGKSPENVDKVHMGLAQISAGNISLLRSIFSKSVGKYNFKVWEEFQRWGDFPSATGIIKTSMTGGRKLGDLNFIVTNNPSELLSNNRFGIFGNITSFAIGSIDDTDVRRELCERLSIPHLQCELDKLVTKKGNAESFSKNDLYSSPYDKAFLIRLDKSVSTIGKVNLPTYLLESDLFKTGVPEVESLK